MTLDDNLKISFVGISLVVQWLRLYAPNAGGLVLIPGVRARSHTTQLRDPVLGLTTQSCSTLCDPMDWSPPGSSVHWILHVRILELAAMPSSRGSSQLRNRIWVSYVSCNGRQFFTTSTTWEAQRFLCAASNRSCMPQDPGQSIK